MDLNTDEKLDLAWYFGAAEGACGIRSIQAGFEATINLLANCRELPHPWLGVKAETLAEREGNRMALRETRSVRLSDDGALGKLENWERARTIHQRLTKVGYRHFRILHLAFGEGKPKGLEFSVALLANTPTAREAHQRSTEAVQRVLSHRLRRVSSIVRKSRRMPKREIESLRAQGVEVERVESIVPDQDRPGEWWTCEPEPVSKVRRRKDAVDERRLWVLWLAAKALEEGGAKADMFAQIQQEARTALERALEAYRKTGQAAA